MNTKTWLTILAVQIAFVDTNDKSRSKRLQFTNKLDSSSSSHSNTNPKLIRSSENHNNKQGGIMNTMKFRYNNIASNSKDMSIIPTEKWKDAMCNVFYYNQTIKLRKCKPLVIERGMCYGRCRSIFIPMSFHSSKACVPQFKRALVTLDCVKNKIRYEKIKYYKKVVSCKCQAI